MNCRKLLAPAALLAAVGLATVAGTVATAGPSKDAAKPAAGGPSEMKLPPGWTAADMQACAAAGTPGRMHAHLAKGAGVWRGKSTMWMAPGADPATSDVTSTATAVMDGRFTKVEWAGELPGMGPYNGLGIYGFDNVANKFVSTWIDNHGTGIMNGVGDLSPDGKTMTWTYRYTCPVTNKPAVLREVETATGPDTKTLEMFGTEPKSGKEFKMMRVEFTRKN